jgi:hypothetical protein
MLVPSFLFGDAREVREGVARAITSFKRGATLEDISEDSGFVDLTEHPESLIWMDRAWSLRAADARDFRAVALTYAIFSNRRLSFEASNELRERSVNYLGRSSWGTALLNSGQAKVWQTAHPMVPLRPSRRAYIATLAGTLEHWDTLVGLGARYYSGGVRIRTFPETQPAYGGLLAGLGVDVRTGQGRWRDIREACGDGTLLRRLRMDDSFWDAFVRGAQARFRTPELLPENIEEIARLCEQGSSQKAHWEFLRAQRGPLATEEILSKLVADDNLDALMMIYVHALDDMERATALYEQHVETRSELRWAADRVARHVAKRDPVGTAATFFASADRVAASLDDRQAVGLVLASLDQARDALFDAGLQDEWHRRLHSFSKAHETKRRIIKALHTAYGAHDRAD